MENPRTARSLVRGRQKVHFTSLPALKKAYHKMFSPNAALSIRQRQIVDTPQKNISLVDATLRIPARYENIKSLASQRFLKLLADTTGIPGQTAPFEARPFMKREKLDRHFLCDLRRCSLFYFSKSGFVAWSNFWSLSPRGFTLWASVCQSTFTLVKSIAFF